jgi:hypothetical protein
MTVAMSVYLSVAPPDGFLRWSDADWERWLRDHPWETAERVCSRGDWAIFLYQLRQHSDRGRKLIEPLLAQLVNERPLSAQEAQDLRAALGAAREELANKPAAALTEAAKTTAFASGADVEAMIAGARSRLGREPTIADVWAAVLDLVDKVLDDAAKERRGVYFGNV